MRWTPDECCMIDARLFHHRLLANQIALLVAGMG